MLNKIMNVHAVTYLNCLKFDEEEMKFELTQQVHGEESERGDGEDDDRDNILHKKKFKAVEDSERDKSIVGIICD